MPNCSKQCVAAQRARYYKKHPGGKNAGSSWTDAEDARVKDMAITDAELSRLLGRSLAAVQKRRCRLRVHENIPSKATPDDGIPYQEKYQLRKQSRRLAAIGTLQKKPCEKCGSPSSEIHHQEYSDPRLILWLCGRCHDQEHIEELRRQRTMPDDPSKK